MKVRELLELLEGVDGEAEVRIVHQPNYPLEARLGGVRLHSESVDQDGDEDPEGEEIVYLVEGSHVGYGKRWVFQP